MIDQITNNCYDILYSIVCLLWGLITYEFSSTSKSFSWEVGLRFPELRKAARVAKLSSSMIAHFSLMSFLNCRTFFRFHESHISSIHLFSLWQSSPNLKASAFVRLSLSISLTFSRSVSMLLSLSVSLCRCRSLSL